MTTDKNQLADYLQAVREIAAEAGEAIMEIYRSDFAVEHKADKSPLTEADLRSHAIIVERLAKLTPDIPVLSEEEKALPFEQRRQWRTYWLIDPIDGTREFVKRNDEFTVNIALIEDHRPVLGIVDAPALDTRWFAAEGLGAWKQVDDKEPEPIQCRALEEGHLVVASTRSHGSPELQAFEAAIGEHESRPMGSSLKFCLVAEGAADLYPRLGPTSEWDTGAAQCVVEQAGGQVTTLDMKPLRYNTKESLLNPFFFVFGKQSRDWSRYLPVSSDSKLS